jgi:hypothetical protein
VYRQDYAFLALLCDPLNFFSVEVNFSPGQRHGIRSAKPGPSKQQERELVISRVIPQPRQMFRRKWFRSVFRVLSRSSFHPDRIFCDHFAFDCKRERAMQNGSI